MNVRPQPWGAVYAECPECNYEADHPRLAQGVLECRRCYAEFDDPNEYRGPWDMTDGPAEDPWGRGPM